MQRRLLPRRPVPRRRSVLARSMLSGFAMLGVGGTISSVVVSNSDPQMHLMACFSHVGGLETGDEVTLNGVRVGRVEDLALDSAQRPCARLVLRADLELDRDTSAAIFTKNMLGEKYVAIEPGGAEELLAPGDQIHYTQSALPLERIMIRLLESQLDSGFE